MVYTREQREHDQKALQVRADLKAFLKSKGKNDLIKMIFEQLDLFQDLQGVAKQLKEENEKLKEPKNES